jgi:hypothetical protein
VELLPFKRGRHKDGLQVPIAAVKKYYKTDNTKTTNLRGGAI